MKKNTFKFLLDFVMTILLLLMFKKNILTLSFHEIGGIFVCVLFILHFFINIKWIFAVSKTIFKKATPAKLKISYFVNILLFLFSLAILISGIGINKTIISKLAFLSKEGVPLHFFCAAIFFILICVHVGLHWDWIKNFLCKKCKKGFSKPLKIVLYSILAITMVFGAINLSNSSINMWLKAIFVTKPAEGFSHPHFSENASKNSVNLIEEKSKNELKSQENFKERNRKENGLGKNKPKITFNSVAIYILKWLSIFVLISALSAFIEKIIKKLFIRQ